MRKQKLNKKSQIHNQESTTLHNFFITIADKTLPQNINEQLTLPATKKTIHLKYKK